MCKPHKMNGAKNKLKVQMLKKGQQATEVDAPD